ncbi:MAG: pantoate--beta-alanine ligase [Myxococcota bacterium]|nr:pantoate--beta-alanine ligase [Myxococcota bacterium]
MTPDQRTLRTLEELTAFRRRHLGRKLVLVPTMGFLHEGHLSLIRMARTLGDVVLTTIFVNPTQFAPTEDLDAYPRDIAGDLNKAGSAGSDAVFVPQPEIMYAPDAATRIHVGPMSQRLCGRLRTQHFSGVCTIVLKLFNLTGCDVAVFGEKDYQQLAVLRRMVRDLNLTVEIVGHPIVRAPDGLAMSSRNSYLSPEARRQARALSQALDVAEALWLDGERHPARLSDAMKSTIHQHQHCRIEYVEVCDPETLISLTDPVARTCLLALAVSVDGTRLIDNRLLSIHG